MFRPYSPNRILLISFLLTILIGAVLLYLPFSAKVQRLSFIDALFTSASAVCVTGLSTIDIGRDLSLPGQIITLLLFQLGGLGIITFSLFFFHLLGHDISFVGREIIQSSFTHTPRQNFQFILKSVMITMIIIEGLGSAVLFLRFLKEYTPWQALYYAIYHAVSAFNNCGYSLFSDSLAGYRNDVTVNLTVMSLIVLGGIGFIVINEIVFKIFNFRKRLSLHSKMTIITTLILIFFGTISFFCLRKKIYLRDYLLKKV